MQYILPISHFTVPFIVLRYISYAICIKAQKFVGMNHSENPVNRSWVLISENCFASVNALLLNSLFLDLRDRAIIFSALPWFCLPVPDDVEAFSSNWNSSETSMRKTRILPASRVRSVGRPTFHGFNQEARFSNDEAMRQSSGDRWKIFFKTLGFL